MNEMKYKGYSAKVEFDPVDKIFVGHIYDIPDIVGFHGNTVGELETAFHEAVDHYVNAIESQLWIEEQLSILEETAGIWTDERHPELKTEADIDA